MRINDVGGRILLADDEKTFALTTARVLERHGMACDWVLSGKEAREALSTRAYDVLVADIKMPGNDDLGLFEALDEEQNRPAVILATGYPSVETAVRSIELGAFAYVVKPFDLGEFVETVRKAMRTTALRRKLSSHSDAVDQLQQRLGVLREELDRNGAHSLDQTASEYLNLLLLSTGEAVMEAVDLLNVLDSRESHRPLRELSAHPDLEMLRSAVDETVNVLERTKRSFKSKELAVLRKRLERLLDLTSGGERQLGSDQVS